MSNRHFSRMPNISIPRTKMKMTQTHSTSFNHGELIPIGCVEVLPGDSFGLKLNSLVRMTQPIVPIMDSLEMSIHAFFCPLRLIYKHTEEFFGENKDSAGYQRGEFQIPQVNFDVGPREIPVYLGKPYQPDYTYTASCLKERVYCRIWSDWYRAQQIQDPFVMLDSDDEDMLIGHIGNKDFDGGLNEAVVPFHVCKKFDYFTASTLSPQYGEEVLLPLGTEAPIVGYGTGDDTLNLYVYEGTAKVSLVQDENILPFKVSDSDTSKGSLLKDGDTDNVHLNMFADLSKATAASVNQIRYAFQLQKYLERANFGSRYFEVLASHFGVSSPDARLQRTEYLGGTTFFINIQQVLSTAGQTLDENTKLGRPGANSTTMHQDYLFNKAFVEHGFIMIMASVRQASHKYSQGVLREDSRLDMFDYYFPEFANLGDQAILNKEIMITGTNDDEVFGYQEHWAEYRYLPDRVSGMLNPNVANSEDYWTLADKYANRPILSAQFIEENRDNLARVLVNGTDASLVNDYIADFYFEYTAVRPLPAYTIPGLIDHFGTR